MELIYLPRKLFHGTSIKLFCVWVGINRSGSVVNSKMGFLSVLRYLERPKKLKRGTSSIGIICCSCSCSCFCCFQAFGTVQRRSGRYNNILKIRKWESLSISFLQYLKRPRTGYVKYRNMLRKALAHYFCFELAG